LQDKIEAIKKLRPILAQCVGICPTDSELEVQSSSQSFDHTSNMMVSHMSQVLYVTITGPDSRNIADNFTNVYPELSIYYSGTNIIVNEHDIKTSHTFMLAFTDIDMFLEEVSRVWDKMYEKIFNEQINRVINGEPI
jgi:hypothetical protein